MLIYLTVICVLSALFSFVDGESLNVECTRSFIFDQRKSYVGLKSTFAVVTLQFPSSRQMTNDWKLVAVNRYWKVEYQLVDIITGQDPINDVRLYLDSKNVIYVIHASKNGDFFLRTSANLTLDPSSDYELKFSDINVETLSRRTAGESVWKFGVLEGATIFDYVTCEYVGTRNGPLPDCHRYMVCPSYSVNKGDRCLYDPIAGLFYNFNETSMNHASAYAVINCVAYHGYANQIFLAESANYSLPLRVRLSGSCLMSVGSYYQAFVYNFAKDPDQKVPRKCAFNDTVQELLFTNDTTSVSPCSGSSVLRRGGQFVNLMVRLTSSVAIILSEKIVRHYIT